MPLDHLKKQPPAKEPPFVPPQTPKPDSVEPIEPIVRYRCGHFASLATFKDINCPPCRDGIRKQNRARKRERYEANLAARIAAGEPDPGAFRFPAGSEFSCVQWDGKEWKAALYVPPINKHGPRHFEGAGTSVERLLRSLKDQYVESLQNAN